MKISKIASMLLIGSMTAMLIGCGDDDSSSSSSSGSGTSSVQASDAYVIAFSKEGNQSGLITAICKDSNKTVTVLATVKDPTKGYIEFNESINGCEITIPTTAYVDADLDGKFNVSKDAIMSMPLKTKVGAARFANPITTYAIETNNIKLLEIAKNFDPVKSYMKAAKDETTKKLLQVAETIKTVSKLGKSIEDLNITENVLDENVTTDTMLGSKLANIKTAVDAKVNAVISLVETLADSNLTSEQIQKVAVQVSDTDKNVSDVINDLNLTVSDKLKNQLQSIDKNITKANEKLPAKLAVPNYITIGNKTVPVVDGKFNDVLVVDNEVKISDYYNIKIPVLAITQKSVTENNSIEVQIKATIKDDDKREVTFVISDVKVYQDENGNTFTKIPANTKIDMSTNITSLKDTIGGDSVDTYIASDMVNSDFDVNVQTLINNVTANQIKINKALNKFNDYLKITNTYTVTIEITDKTDNNLNWFMNLPKENNTTYTTYTINGNVKVSNTDITPPQPGDLNGSSTSNGSNSGATGDEGTSGEEVESGNGSNSGATGDEGTSGEEV